MTRTAKTQKAKSKSKTTPKTTLFWEVRIHNLPRSLEPGLTVWLFNHGCWGTQEILDFTQPDLKYNPEIRPHRIISMSAYFPVTAKESAEVKLQQWLHARTPDGVIEWDLKANQDWLSEWKKHFKSFSLAGLRFIPSWKVTGKTDRKKAVIIEPGMAFGTGTHATTQFAIQMLKRLEEKDLLKNKTVIDVGAGSGILSVVAERFGAKSALAIDNDPECWRECEKMFKINRAKKCMVNTKQSGAITQKYDVVIANIIDGVLIEIKNHLHRMTKDGGYIILSGILTDGAPAFEKSFLKGFGGKVVLRLSDTEWTSLLISK